MLPNKSSVLSGKIAGIIWAGGKDNRSEQLNEWVRPANSAVVAEEWAM